MFSPYYAWARRRGRGDPLHHCALNVALYGRGGKRWALTERGRGAVQRDAGSFVIGPSSLTWDGDALTVRIDEVTAPLPSRIRGVVRVRPGALAPRTFELDAAGRHRWRPIAPCARVEVELERPGLRWSGPAYLDTNDGDRALEDDFAVWDWCRAKLAGGDTAILYNVVRSDGGRHSIAIRCDAATGAVEEFEPPPTASLPPTLWRVARPTRADAGHRPAVTMTLEDAPFYSRSVISTRVLGEDATAVHESLDLGRFRAGWVQAMLPFKVPRALR